MSNGRHRAAAPVPAGPPAWPLAADGQGGTAALRGAVRGRQPVNGRRADPLVALLAGLAMALVVGLSWFLLELDGAITSPTVVAVAGALIGIAVRVGGGPFDPALRATIALLLFLVTTLVVSFLVVRHQLAQLDPDLPLAFEERVFLRDRVLAPGYALATAAGAWLSVQTNYLRARRW